MANNSFVFYESYFEAIEEFDGASQLRLYKAICSYAINGEEPELKGLEKAVFTLIKPTIDANSMRKEAAKKGGRPRREQREEVPAATESIKEETEIKGNNGLENEETNGLYFFENKKTDGFENEKPNVNVNDNVNEDINENVNVNEKRGAVAKGNSQRSDAPKRKNFVKPTLAEIENYCRERNNSVSARNFFDFYESKGWCIGKNKMKDWKAAVRTWEIRQRESVPAPPTESSPELEKYKILANRF